jgi:hypothetical protein
MAGAEINKYAAELNGHLAGVGVTNAEQLTALASAAANLATLADSPAGTITSATWAAAQAAWETARDAFGAKLAEALLGPLAKFPGVADLAMDSARLTTEGIHGDVDLGPVHLQIASSVLVIQPPAFSDAGGTPPSVAIGPYQVGQIAASMSSPFGGGKGLPGGGSLLRLPDGAGYGGTLELPLGPLQVSAAAVVGLIDGNPSVLAILGAQFIPPIQLSFGFSLDRVGGIVGVNRRADSDRLRDAVRTGIAGDVLFAVNPPPSPLTLVTAADRIFPGQLNRHLVGPSLKLAWLSFGPAGSLLGLNLGVIVEIPTGKVAVLGVGRVAIPGLEFLLNLRLDVLGLVDPPEQLVSIDASLVDSHVLGVFEVYGDAAMRFSWGSSAYFVVSVGGFFPGFNPEPARLPPMRRVGFAVDNPLPVLQIRSEGYFAITSNSVQLGGRMEIAISLVIEAHGFVEVDTIVQFRPFYFQARIAAGFAVSVAGLSFASVMLEGSIAGPGPLVIRGALSISVFILSISWDESFTLGSGSSDVLPTPPALLDVIAAELSKPETVQSESIADPQVVLRPRPVAEGLAAVPPTGALRVSQRRAPLGLLIDRVDGRPLGEPQGVKVTGGTRDVSERFSPGSYITLTQSEALNRPPFDVLPSGRVLSMADPPLTANLTDEKREVEQIVIIGGTILRAGVNAKMTVLAEISALVAAAGRSPALSSATPMVTATGETWKATGSPDSFSSATAAHQFTRYSKNKSVALASTDAAAAVNLAGV